MKLTSKRRQADILWRKAARRLFNNTCFACGRNGTEFSPLEVHHVVGRNAHVRIKLENACTLCCSCHAHRHDTANGKAWLDTLIEDRFPEWFSLLQDLRRVKPHRYTEQHLDADIERLKKAGTNGDVE